MVRECFFRLVLLSQSFGKKINSQKSKEPLFLEFPIFLPGLTSSTNFLFRLVLLSQSYMAQ
ncbi:hypothetical protein BN424_3592 [Carnobacterium maltaromaticum LMA28]|uniref:Uncharacterized protein n=1 Tax=Carnobacterium maltaromaticum LMA28 TaxID=1234679 RepID=K8EM66_CARML|nr:hypothetical protein BN424_3592 [Carnobacterium maltaromaticum LMA28]